MTEYQQGEKHKERDIPHATCITDNLNRRAKQIKEHLDQVLKVCTDSYQNTENDVSSLTMVGRSWEGVVNL